MNAVTISPIEMAALKKLAVISGAVAASLPDLTAAREQMALTRVLIDVIGRAEAPATPTK